MSKFFHSRTDIIITTWFVAVALLGIFLVASLSGILPGSEFRSSGRIPASVTDFLRVEECLRKPWAEQNPCLDDFVMAYAGDKSIREILADMEISRTRSTLIEDSCHPVAHAIGRYALTLRGNVGDAFESCDFSCHSGCYHGVMERMFYGEGEREESVRHLTLADLRDRIPGICSRDKFHDPKPSLIFQCLHGVGHAVLYTLDYKLEDALAACDLLDGSYEQSSCYGGVVMENITAFERQKRDINRDDPHYPCDKLADKYRSSCYLMQTSIMFELGYSSEEIADLCPGAGEYQHSCFVSLGRDLSNTVRTGSPDHVADVCERFAGKHGKVSDCVSGAVYALIDNTWDGRFALNFCGRLQNPENIHNCFLSSISYMNSTYQTGPSEIYRQCGENSGEKNSQCQDAVKELWGDRLN